MLRLEVGKSYITREGILVKIEGFRKPDEGDPTWNSTPLIYYMEKSNRFLTWDRHGNFLEGESCAHDLVKEATWKDKLRWKLLSWGIGTPP